MKKNSTLYLVVGLVVLLALIILVFGIFFLNDKDPREKFQTFYLRFPQVSTLALDDPVKVNGVKLGKVETIELSGHRVTVKIKLREDVKIPKDSEIRVQNIGIMGERQIGMILGDSPEHFAPLDTIVGQFDAGIAEALGLVGEVCDTTMVLIRTVKNVLNTTVGNDEFQNRFQSILSKAETLEDRLIQVVRETDPQLKKSLSGLNEATEKVNALLDNAQTPIDNIFSNTNVLLTDASGLVQNLDAVTKKLADLTQKLESTDNTAGLLLNDRALHDDLVQTVHSADSLFRLIIQDGLDINVDFF